MMEKKLSHAYMLVGPEGEGRDAAARELSAALLCPGAHPPCRTCRDCKKALAGIHPDVTWLELEPDDKGKLRRELVVGQSRRIAADACVAPNEAQRKVYIIHQANLMNTAAQNALLKPLEEPPGHACFILCTVSADALLVTVRSRCVRVDDERREAAPARDDMAEFAAEYLWLCAGGDAAALLRFCLLRGKLTPEQTLLFVERARADTADILCGRRPDPGLGREKLWNIHTLLDKAGDYLRYNVGPKQVFGALAAESLKH